MSDDERDACELLVVRLINRKRQGDIIRTDDLLRAVLTLFRYTVELERRIELLETGR